jgi:predicted ester cyclase
MDNRQLISEFMNTLWNGKDLEVIHRIYDDEVVIHSPLGNYYGPEAMERIARVWIDAFPDMQFLALDTVSEGDKVVVQWETKATHRGELRGIHPSGRIVTYPGISVFQLRDGIVVKYWAYVDTQMVLDQLSDPQN